ncbi:hypothetical protein [Varibaculum cambriense]|uniref:hypothetical protein n=1 Tax=Varibaculum cambriense TaxID=184870 RepID=UPI00290D0EF8|nr:hypothetical protein [Varibaculum cambriense]MDU5541410.1 hypothetical protein [Varibaculum cambriense]
MTYTPQPDNASPAPQGSPMPDSPQFSPVNPQMSPDAMSPATPTKKPKTGLIVTIVIVAVLVVALIGLFIANTLVASTQERSLKNEFVKEGFSNVRAEINSSPMLLSYFKDYYREAKVTASAGTFATEGSKQNLKMKDVRAVFHGLKGGDNPIIEKGNMTFTLPGEEFDKAIKEDATASKMNMRRNGNKITAEAEEQGLKIQVEMGMHFEPGKDGQSGKLFLVPDKFMINGSDEFMGQKLSPADMGMKKEEIPMDLNKAFVLKNVDFSGEDIKFDIDVKNIKLNDIGN